DAGNQRSHPTRTGWQHRAGIAAGDHTAGPAQHVDGCCFLLLNQPAYHQAKQRCSSSAGETMNPAEFLTMSSLMVPDREAVVSGDGSIRRTYAELATRVNQ